MPEITAEMVKNLREATAVSMMECKRALVESNGDMTQATRILREKGMATAAKKASRATNQGLIVTAMTKDRKTVSLCEINCETDFVARNQDFVEFTAGLAGKACTMDGSLADAVRDEVSAKIVKIGENIVVRRNTRYMLSGTGALFSYIHQGGKVGLIMELACSKPDTPQQAAFQGLGRDLTLHVAAANPKYLTSAEVPAGELEAEKAIYAKQVEGKPAQIVAKIVEGKVKKYFQDICLVDQPFVKEPKQAIHELVEAVGKQLGDTVSIRRFTRYQLGE